MVPLVNGEIQSSDFKVYEMVCDFNVRNFMRNFMLQ